MLRGKFTALNTYIKTEERPKINNLSLHLRKLENEEQIKSKVSRKKEIIMIRAEINEIENRRKSTKPKASSLEKISLEKTLLVFHLSIERINKTKASSFGGGKQ